MQSLERILSAPTGGGEAGPVREKNHGHAAPDEFGRLMQRALSAKSKESPREIALRAERKHAASVKNSSRPESDPEDSSTQAISSQDPEKEATQSPMEAKFHTAEVSIWPLADLNDPLPAWQLPLPTSGCFSATQTAVDFSATATSNAVATAMPLAKDAGAVTPVAGENLNSETSAAEKTTSLTAELAPANAGEIPTAQKSEPNKQEAAVAANALLNNTVVEEMAKPAASAEQKSTESMTTAISATHAPENGGTGVATVEVPMKKNANTNKVAGLDGKVLPGDASRSTSAKVLPTPTLAGPVRSADTNAGEANINLTLPDTFASVDFSAAQTLAILPSLTDARMRNLERTHDMVALHAVRLVEAHTDTLSVVIKPGAGTELSLELRQRDGCIEAHAVLSRGDFQLMNQHWAELQQRLEQRGIKLAPLGGEANFSTDSGGSFKQQQPSSRELEAQKASAFAEFALAGRTLGATARLAVGGWESWA